MQKVKTALLSFGMSGQVFHAPFLTAHPGFELVGSWERSQSLLHKVYPLAKSYASFESLLEDDIDLVVVNTPVETHFEYTKRSLLAGKHTVVEKAFTTTVAEATELDSIAKEKGLILSIFQNRRWDSDFKTVQEIIRKGILGDIVEAEFHFDRYNPNLSAKKHKESLNLGAGLLKDLGPHIIDQALFLFGMPAAVFADIRITRAQSVVDDYFDILLFYSDFRVRLKSGFFVREAIAAYIIHGTKGSFLKARGDIQEDDLKAGKLPSIENWGREPEYLQGILHTEVNGVVIREKVPTVVGNYYDFFDQLYQAVVHHGINPVTAVAGIQSMTIIETAILSSKEKRVINL
jgi:scyllo-inositol 2-dehydrogenase (NADP+)